MNLQKIQEKIESSQNFYKRVCNKQNHDGRIIEIICLQDDCHKNRLGCFFCSGEEHRSHNVAFLTDKINTPLLLLKVNSAAPESQEYKSYFQDKLKNIENECSQFHEIFRESINKLSGQYRFQLKTISNIFQKDMFQTALKAMLDDNLDPYYLEKYVKMINFLSNIPNLIFLDKLKKKTQEICGKTISAFKKAKNRMQNVLKDLEQDLKQANFTNGQIPSSKFFEKKQAPEKIRPLMKQKEMIPQQPKQIHENQIEQPTIKMSKIKNFQKKGVKNKNNTTYFLKRKDKEYVYTDNSNKDFIIFISPQNSQENQYVPTMSKNSKQVNQSYEQFLDQCLMIYENNNKQLSNLAPNSQQLAHMEQQDSTILHVHDDTKPTAINQTTVRNILKDSKDLQQLSIIWSYQLSKKNIEKLLLNLPNLKRISFGNCLNFTQDILDLVIDLFPNLQFLNYGVDWSSDTEKFLIDSHFFNCQRYRSLKTDACLKLTKLQKLQNVWITYCDNDNAAMIIKKMKNLNSISLGGISFHDSPQRKLTLQMVKQLKERKNLTTLSFQSLTINEKSFSHVLFANRGLKNISFTQCVGITDQTINNIKNYCSDLHTFRISCMDTVQGLNIWQMNQLKTLVLMGCWNISPDFAEQGISNLTKLQYLDISFNMPKKNRQKYSIPWVSSSLLKKINHLRQLKYLNIYDTDIANLSYLTKLTNLQTFVCGRNTITPKYFIEFLGKNKQIKKLNIQNFGDRNPVRIKNEHLHEILAILPNLTHLNICHCQITMTQELIDKLKGLKCLSIEDVKLVPRHRKALEDNKITLCLKKTE